MSLAIMLGGARPVASDRALPMVGAHVASTCGDDPSRRQPPSRFRPGFALAASHGRPIGARRRRYPTSAPELTYKIAAVRRSALLGGLPPLISLASARNARR